MFWTNQTLRFSWIAFFFFLGLGSPTHLGAQGNPTERQVAELFKNPKKIKWYKYYQGRVDDLNDVGLIIAYDGKDCKGFITYLRSKERFKLEGNLKGDKIKLRETDTEESVTGHFEGQFYGDFSKLKAHWFNREKTRAGLLMLSQVEHEVVFPTYCGDNKWVRKYEGLIMGQTVEFILQRNSELDLKGIIWYKEKNRSHHLKGGMISETEFKVVITDELCHKLGAIQGSIQKPSFEILGHWISPEGEQHRVKFDKTSHITVGCIEYQDYMSTYDVIFPKSKNASFNAFINDIVGEWKISCKEQVKKLKEEREFPGPEDRAIAHAAGWFNIEYMSEHLVSGFITFNKSWEEEHQDLSFTYSLLNDEKVGLEDIFREGVEYHQILLEKALMRLKYKPLYANAGFKEWITTTSFPHFTIRENGINYSTVFHPIYGRQSVTIPYDEMEEYLNPYSPISFLYLDIAPIKRVKKKKKNK